MGPGGTQGPGDTSLLASNITGSTGMEDKVRTAIIDELTRRAEETADLDVSAAGGRLVVNGPIDVDALVMVVIGSMAGGP